MAALESSTLDSGGQSFAGQVDDLFVPLRRAYGAPAALDDEQLQALSRRLAKVIFYTNNVAYRPLLASTAKTLEEHSLLSEDIRRSLRSSAVRLRDFELMDHVAGAGADPRTAVRQSSAWDANQPGVIRAATGDGGIQLANVDLEGFDAIMVYGPYCQPSKRALAAIMADPALADFFRHSVLWLFPVDGSLYLQPLTELADIIPAGNSGIAYSRQAWPFITSWATPTLYVRDGNRYRQAFQGWPSDQRLDEVAGLVRAARR
ncbi:hypothetical protein [Pseudoxanthomonas dokdonensis]|uniref:Uncharacterized protein n=1 Tax=Pseudoxanthomonas dokdonensis TaxID=344882 RepID=A0A0R0CIR3_9GAMM|nr:hypothetical protein [Pseudoxanthomonas dokdonensis]KRG69785.1 hypothetical protein ABB29_08270 [Pseudoxanthomonas dokdonensis]